MRAHEKGGGWKLTALEDPLRFRGPQGFDPDTGEFHPKPPAGKTWGAVFTDALSELASEDERVVAVTAAMPSGTGLRNFAKTYPIMYDVGICEQRSFGFVQGLAISGLCPILAPTPPLPSAAMTSSSKNWWCSATSAWWLPSIVLA